MRKQIFLFLTLIALISCKKEIEEIAKENSGTVYSGNQQGESQQSLSSDYFNSQGGFWDVTESKQFGGVAGDDTARKTWPSLYNIREASATVQCNGQLIDTIFFYGDSAVYFRLKFKNNEEFTQSARDVDFDPDPDNMNCQHLGLRKFVSESSDDGNWSYDVSLNRLTWTKIVHTGPDTFEVVQTSGIVTYISEDEFLINGSVQTLDHPNPGQFFIEYRIKRKTGN